MRRIPLRVLALVVLCIASFMTQFGCATYTAVTIPGPVDDEKIEVGMHRSQVESMLRATPESEYSEGFGKFVRYAYMDGVHQASKARVIIYIAGDVFTAFLSELVFWPIEAYAKNRTKRIGTAHYDAENQVLTWKVARTDGEELIAVGVMPEASDVAAQVPSSTVPADVVAGHVENGAADEPRDDSGVDPVLPAVSAEMPEANEPAP